MEYTVEIYDTWGRRVASFDEVPLLDVIRTSPDEKDVIRGMLPKDLVKLGHHYRVRVLVNNTVFCEATVKTVSPSWSDTVKLILDKYVPFHEVLEFEGECSKKAINPRVSRTYINQEVSAIVKDCINRAAGPLHYTVAHTAYPEGAAREYQKFLGRKTVDNELEAGGIAAGQWVGRDRIDFSQAYAKDGDTIAGLIVDGVTWPDLRMLMIGAEETALNGHAIARHPEVADWTEEQYAVSAYKLRGDAAKEQLAGLLAAHGIDYIELNSHRNASGQYDDRVDAYGRYIGLVFGGGLCFNAAMVECGLAGIYLWQEGRYHDPDMALKDFYSYAGVHNDSVESSGVVLGSFEVLRGAVMEVLTALSYAADGFTFSVGPDSGVRFRKALSPDRAVFFDPLAHGVQLGSETSELCNRIGVQGNPMNSSISESYGRDASMTEHGVHDRLLTYYPVSRLEDARKLADGLLQDVAYPTPSGSVTFFQGDPAVRVGDLLELRGAALRRLEPELSDEWAGRFSGKLVGRVRKVRHRFTGKHVETQAHFTSPLRSVAHPISFMVQSQEPAGRLYELRLDDVAVGLDMGFHLD